MNREKIKILIADDEEKILTRLKRILSNEGYETDTAHDGTAALQKLTSSRYDVFLTDINMPDKNGFEIMEYIKDAGIDTLPLVLTGFASMESAIRAIQLGAYDFIQKPIDAETLKLIIRRAAERITLFRQNEKNLIELKKLNELKDEFITLVSHDLRSPLSSIGGYANHMLKSGGLTDSQKRYLLIIREIADSMYSLVNELLDISKIEAGVIQIERGPTDIAELITDSINNFTLLASDKNNTIDYINDLRDNVVHIDPVKMHQVINNLVNNAVKFTENGRIVVRSWEYDDPSHIRISVSDTGIGIPDEAFGKLFDKFTLFHTEGTRGEKGTGLGLVICKMFVELHGGSIRAGKPDERGSVFEILLPRGIPQ